MIEKQKLKTMRTAIALDITYDQLFSLVKKLPPEQKIKLSKELEMEGIKSKLTSLLISFKTDKLSQDTINKEVEQVRQKIYESRKKH